MPDIHAMVDIETMSTQVNAAILSVGCVLFNPRGANTEESLLNTLYVQIDPTSNQQFDRHVDIGTVVWWLQQEKAAQEALVQGNLKGLRAAMTEVRMFLTAHPSPTRIWAKSPDFDCKILESACRATKEIWPFKYNETRCVRTIIEAAYPEGDHPEIGVGVAHNALDDAKRQVLAVQDAIRKLGA